MLRCRRRLLTLASSYCSCSCLSCFSCLSACLRKSMASVAPKGSISVGSVADSSTARARGNSRRVRNAMAPATQPFQLAFLSQHFCRPIKSSWLCSYAHAVLHIKSVWMVFLINLTYTTLNGILETLVVFVLDVDTRFLALNPLW